MIMDFQISYLGLNSGRDAEGMMKRGVPVLGFEPVPAHCEALRNAFLHGPTGSKLMCGVATDKEGGEVPMFIGTGNGTPRSTLHKEIVEDLGFKTETVQVPCYTVSNHIPSDILKYSSSNLILKVMNCMFSAVLNIIWKLEDGFI